MSDKDLQGYAVELANEALQDYEFIAVTENCEELTHEECIQVHDLIAKRVKAYIPTEPQIIRTVEELEALDPDMILMNKWGDLFDPDNIYSGIGLEEDHDYYFPCVKLTDGSQVRAARKAMEEEDA